VSGGRGGYPGPGYGAAEYGDDGYGPDGSPPADGEPQWDDSVWQRDQPDAWGPQDPNSPQGYDPQGYGPQGYDRQGYEPQAHDPQAYNGQGYGGQDYDGPGYAAQPYADQPYAGQPYEGQPYESQPYESQPYESQPYESQGYPDRGAPGSGPAFPPPGPQRYPRTGAQEVYPSTGAQEVYPRTGAQEVYPSTGAQEVYPGSGAQPAYPGSGAYPAQPGQRGPATGSRPVQRGSGSLPQVPPGYDQRGTGAHRMAGAGPGGYEDPRWEQPPGDDSFLPGFGPRDDFEGGRGRGQARSGNDGRTRDGRRGRAADRGQAPAPGGDYNGYDDPRTQRAPVADPRRRDPRDPRDPREPGGGYPDGPTYPAAPARPDAGGRAGRQDRQQGLLPAGPGSDGRGPDPRARGPRRDAQDDDNGRGYGSLHDADDLDDLDDDLQPRHRRRSPIRRLAPWIALLVIVVPLAIGGWHIYGIWRAKAHPADYVGAGTAPTVTVQVLSGETADQLAPTLFADGVVASTRAFVIAAENSSDPTGLEPGFFVLNRHMQASLAWSALLNPKNRDQALVTIPEGKRATQVIATLANVTKIPLKDFQQVIAHPAQLGLPSYADGKVEGFLFPATYAIQPHETALQILQAMVARYNVEAQQIDLQAAAHKLGISERDVIIEASMAQAEGGSVSDYPKIAEVINNRLKAGMPLQFDSVLLYGLNKYAINVTDAQIATPGPYNDFEHDGLPPGPIANPGNAAIEGILRPDTGNWLFFLTVTGGKSEFSAHALAGQ